MIALSKEQIETFNRDGYVVIDTGISESVIDGVVSDLSEYWGEDRKIPQNVSYADNGRIQDAWKISANCKILATYPDILQVLESLYQRKVYPFQTLNFYKGTEQAVHTDTIHFNSEPFGVMCGVWIALEDIGPEQGALIYYPGSQKLPEINFEDAGLEPNYDNYPEYEVYLQKLIDEKGLKPEYGILKKGQALIWAANLLHGGSKQKNKELTRKSQVTHYYFEGSRYWRPGYSKNRRAYFEPAWIPYKGSNRNVSKFKKLKAALLNRIFK